MKPFNYVLLGNGRVARDFLASPTVPSPRLVVLNSRSGKQRFASEIRELASARGAPVQVWSDATRLDLLTLTHAPNCWLLSVYFGDILDAEVLDAFDRRAVNLHPSLLPWGRGAHTNVWPIVTGEPAGVTLHGMENAVDRGAILIQRQVMVEPWDTAKTLYEKLETVGLELLLSSWPNEVLRLWPGTPQETGGSFHSVNDLLSIEPFDLGTGSDARRFFDQLRALTFPPFAGLRVAVDGHVVEARIELSEVRNAD